MSDLPTVTSRQMLRAMVRHREVHELVVQSGKNVDLWITEFECKCGVKCGKGVRAMAYEMFAKHVITAALKENNDAQPTA